MKFLVVLFLPLLLFASVKDIENKIANNTQQYKNIVQRKTNIHKTLNDLAEQIAKEMVAYNNIIKILDKTDTQILLNKIKLSNAINKVQQLKSKSVQLKELKKKIEKDVIEFVIEKYSMSMGIEQANKKTMYDVLNKEVYTLVFNNTKEEILDLNIMYLKVNSSIRTNEKAIDDLTKYIEEQNNIKKRYKELEKVQKKSLASLEQKHKLYQKTLQKLEDKQNYITNLLGDLKILKKKEIEAERKRRKRERELARKRALEKKRKEALERAKLVKKRKSLKFTRKYKDNINIDVKKLGSSTKGIKISKYNGRKTIAPLKSYVVLKKFGKYYDKVYKMELFNESVSLKTKKPYAKVYSVFKGQVVYAKKDNGLLGNVVIVKHRDNLHTIYSHLDQISPTLKVGKWIPKGYVVGRVNDTLEFQATKNSKYIDPMKLIK